MTESHGVASIDPAGRLSWTGAGTGPSPGGPVKWPSAARQICAFKSVDLHAAMLYPWV